MEGIREPIVGSLYRFGQQELTYNLLAGHSGFLGRLLIPSLGLRNSRSVHFTLAAKAKPAFNCTLKLR